MCAKNATFNKIRMPVTLECLLLHMAANCQFEAKIWLEGYVYFTV